MTRQAPTGTNHDDVKLEDLRPEDVMERYRALRAEDLRPLFGGDGALRPAIQLERACPSCGKADAAAYFTKDGFHFVRCNGCRLVYVNPILTETAIAAWYATSNSQKWFEEQALARSMDVRIRRIFRPRLEQLAEWFPAGGRLLDVGCSRGFFLALARDMGWEPYGVEIDPALAAETADRTGARTWGGRFEDVDIPVGYFDVVTVWEVVEHVLDPQILLRRVFEILKPGGVLMLTTPNFAGIEFEAVGASHANIEAPAHINYFTPATLRAVLERCGFSDIAITTPGQLDLDNVLEAIQRTAADGIGDRFLKRLAAADGFDEVRRAIVRLIQENGLSGNMQVIARRP